ncbi:MAG: hypothetical protein IT449_00195 [Phycisphaerales bacterium]|nr:hypothetical protein [Phycisphaerales bacterium]
MEGIVNLLCVAISIYFWVLIFKHVIIPVFRFGARNPELTKRSYDIARRFLRR